MSKTDDFFEDLFDIICSHREYMRMTIPVLIVMAFFLAFSTFFVDVNDSWFPIYVIDVVLLVVFFVFIAGTYRYCTKREMDEIRDD
jgi:membrane protein YdbS with pleckstrin-like domain